MKRKISLIYLLLILVLNSSCVEKQSRAKEANKPEFIALPKVDSLKFISGIRTIYQDRKGNYWFASHNEGVSYYDGNSFKYLTINDGLADNQIHSIQEDRNGDIWFDGKNKITKYDGEKFLIFEKSKIPKADLIRDSISLSDSDLWFRYNNDFGIYRFDGRQLSFIQMEEPTPNKINGRLGFGVTGVSKIIDGKIWFGTSYAGLFGFNGKVFQNINNETLGLNIRDEFLHIRSIFSDSKGNLWIGNNGIGVLLKAGDSIVNFSKEQGKLFDTNPSYLSVNDTKSLQAVFAIEEDKNGNIWFGDRDSRAWKYDGEKLKNYSIDEALQGENLIHTIYNDKSGNLWFIFTNGAVYKLTGETFEKFHGFIKK